MDERTRGIVQRGHLTCHCLLIENRDGLTLVDTGFGLRDVVAPRTRLSGLFMALLSPEFREEMTAIRQIERLGFDPRDVRHIVMTHLDFDHAGGLDDFPEARVHLLAAERDHAMRQATWLDRQRFRPQQWSNRDHWCAYPQADGGKWFGFDSVRALEGLSDEVLLIPLPGHTFGHVGVAVRGQDRWLLHAGDAYFHHREMDLDRPGCPIGLRLYQTMLEKNRAARLSNQRRLRELKRAHAGEIDIFSAHDVPEFERLSGRSARIPASAGNGA